MSDPRTLKAPFSKIDRARSLLKEFTEAVDGYGNRLFVHIVKEPDETGLLHVKIKTFVPVPDIASHLAAEIIYHVRSALDQMIGEIGRQSGLNDTRHLYFPFVGSRSEFDDKGTQKKIKGLPQDVKDLIKSLEPFKDGNETLWGLSAFSNVDKHNMLIPIGGIGIANMISGVRVDGGGHPGSVGMCYSGPGNLLEGITISKIGPTGSFHADNLGIQYWVGFGDVPVFSHRPSVPTLNELIDLGESVIQRFSRHCFGG